MRNERQPFMGIAFLFMAVLTIGASDSKLESLTAHDWPKLMQQARKGNHRAQTRVGMAFERGEVVKQDFSEAVKWFSKAAEQADPVAEHNLGVMYYQGTGVQRNLAEAAKWFEKAAAGGLPEAQFKCRTPIRDRYRCASEFRQSTRSVSRSGAEGLRSCREQPWPHVRER